MSPLLPALDLPARDSALARPALRCPDRALSYAELLTAAGRLAPRLAGHRRVAVWATATTDTAVAVVAAAFAGVPAVPVDPMATPPEVAHVVRDSAPDAVLAPASDPLPPELADLPRPEVPRLPPGGQFGNGPPPPLPATPDPETPALVLYTGGTTGPPRGVVLSQRAIAVTLDALADAWRWTSEDVVVHALPPCHVAGLVLGLLGPLRRGGTAVHLGRCSPPAVARALDGGGTMLLGMPNTYRRLAEAVDGPWRTGPSLTRALARSRLLACGPGPLPAEVRQRLEAATGRDLVACYGMTETPVITSAWVGAAPATGTVGTPLPGAQLRLVDDTDAPLPPDRAETVGEVHVRGPHLFTEYLHRPEATAAAFTEGWFRTGDLRDTAGRYRIVGRRATHVVVSGGQRIATGEIENALLSHPGVAEAAVTGAPDASLGERVVAWVVSREAAGDRATPAPTAEELTAHVGRLLAPHKWPREIRFRSRLPRDVRGNVRKGDLA